MASDPKITAASETPTAARLRDITQMTPAQARAMRGDMVRASELPAEPIASTRDIPVRGAQGDIPARVYTPEGSSLGNPRPILLWFHGGGMVIGDNYVQSDRSGAPDREPRPIASCSRSNMGWPQSIRFSPAFRTAARRYDGRPSTAARSGAIRRGWRSTVTAEGDYPPRYRR